MIGYLFPINKRQVSPPRTRRCIASPGIELGVSNLSITNPTRYRLTYRRRDFLIFTVLSKLAWLEWTIWRLTLFKLGANRLKTNYQNTNVESCFDT